MRRFISFHTDNPQELTRRFISLSGEFKEVCILHSNSYRRSSPMPEAYHNYDLIAAAGSVRRLTQIDKNPLDALEDFITGSGDWIFGHLSYDLKNEIENLTSSHPDHIGFPLLNFYVPRYIFIISANNVEVGWRTDLDSEEQVRCLIKEAGKSRPVMPGDPLRGTINRVISKSSYLDLVGKVKSHILRGDIYEMNFCQEFFCEQSLTDPLSVWIRLIEESPTPFSCYYRLNGKHLLCASPERFLRKSGTRIISQPIKGTAARGRTAAEDNRINRALASDIKERAENIMITDLVRNDLSRIAETASVKVDELCGVYPFPGVFQLISGISARVLQNTGFTDIIKATFPMGSMTGAPKIRAMEIIEHYEKTRRGLYSGTVGYITPSMDFDFNVVIRSIQYNEADSYISWMVGGAITGLSVPENEYHECLLKAGAINKVLGNDSFL